jgi:hypothetical protein
MPVNIWSYKETAGKEVYVQVPGHLCLNDILYEFGCFLQAQGYVLPVGMKVGLIGEDE